MTTPRKIRLDLATPPEVALRAAMAAVEAMPPDTRLTMAGLKVQEALDLVSAYVDEQMRMVDIGAPRSVVLTSAEYDSLMQRSAVQGAPRGSQGGA